MYAHYFTQRPAAELPVYAALLESLQAQIEPCLLDNLPRMTFALIKPDTYLRGLVPVILDLLRENGVCVHFISRATMDAALIDDLYLFEKQQFLDNWWVMEKAFTLGPALPLLLIGSPGAAVHVSRRMRDLIGPSEPVAGQPHQLRYRLRGTHRVLNLIHGSDDPAAAAREALLFFSVAQLRSALQAANLVDSTMAPTPLQQPDAGMLQPACICDLRLSQVLLGIKSRLFAMLQQALVSVATQAAGGAVPPMLDLLRAETLVVAKQLPLREEQRELAPILREQREHLLLLDTALSSLGAPAGATCSPLRPNRVSPRDQSLAERLIQALLLFVDDARLRYAKFDQILHNFRTLPISCEPYEEVILHTWWGTMARSRS